MNDHSQQIDQMLSESPLLAFSVYTEIQIRIIRNLGKELLNTLDRAFDGENVDGNEFNRAYGQFWLWVIGSYEVVRTMCQASTCFSNDFYDKLKEFKRNVSVLRMPFAKQEYQGSKKKKPVGNETSVYGIDTIGRNFTFEVNGTIISVRGLLASFEDIFGHVKSEDILSDHRQSPNYTG